MIEQALNLAINQFGPYLAMLTLSFASATLLPVSSEVLLVAQIKAGLANSAGLVTAATIGNVGGSTFNWWLGQHLRRFESRKWFPFASSQIALASQRFHRYGIWSLLLAWLPVIGDPLTLVAGVLKVPLLPFLALVTAGKAARYIALAAWI